MNTDIEKFEKHSNFVRLAEARTLRAIKQIQLIRNLANRSKYEYTEAEYTAIIDALSIEVHELKNTFDKKNNKQKPFTLFTNSQAVNS
jgi:hypothetical protein